MENDYVVTLDYLLKIKAEKKKKEPSRIERDEYNAAWVKLAVVEGFSERVERYLYNGVSYCGAKPFKEYLDRIENKEQAVQSFFTGKMYGTNAETTFRLLVHLLALLLNDKKTAPLTSLLIMRFPNACFNKDKKKLGNIETILLKYFFAELDYNVQLIPLTEIKVKKAIFVVEFISAMEDAMVKINTSGLSKGKVSNIAKVKQWFEEYRQAKVEGLGLSNCQEKETSSASAEPPNTSGETPANANHTIDLVQGENNVEETGESGAHKREPDTAVDLVTDPEAENESSEMSSYLVELLGKAGKAAVVIKAEKVQLKNKIDSLTKALEREQDKQQQACQQINELQSVVADLRKRLSDYESEIFVLKRDIEQRDSIISEKDAEISERIKMADVLSRDRNKQADETLQRVASKIKVEYRDFIDAVEVPMSCDLGENLRLQLQSVFDILEKGGMKIK